MGYYLKNNQMDDIRPICVGSILRKLMTEAHNSHKEKRNEILSENIQFGIKKDGFEIGVLTTRGSRRNSW